MNMLRSASRKYTYILWCLLFMAAYIGYSYCITHYVLSIAYVKYLTFSMNLVSKGVVSYLLGSFTFFMICIFIEAGIATSLLLLLRKGLVRASYTLVDRDNVYHFSTVCNILLNFFIAVGFVFLLGIKDNFFEMFYLLFETGLSEESVTVERMAYDVEINWIFCDVLVFKMLFETFFKKDALDQQFKKLEPDTQDVAYVEEAETAES